MAKKQQFDLKDKKYQWDLKKSVFKKDETPDQVLNDWYKNYCKLMKTVNDCWRSGVKLKQWIELYNKTEQQKVKVAIFIKEKLEAFPKATKWKSLNKKYKDLLAKINKKDLSFGDFILKHEKQIKQLLNRPELKEYKRLFDIEFFQYRDHLVSRQDARTIDTMQSDAALDIIYNGIVDDAIDHGVRAVDSKGKDVTAKYHVDLFSHKDPAVRRSAWIDFNNQFYIRRYAYSALFYVTYYRGNQKARMYKYSNALESKLKEIYELKLDEYLKILENTAVLKDLYIRYKDQYAGITNYTFGNTVYEPWDKKLMDGIKYKRYSPQEAKEIINQSFKCFGPEFHRVATNILNSKLIQWSNNGSRHDNFTWGAKGNLNMEPIKLDYTGDIFSVASLAHEIGHSISYYYVKRNQKTYKYYNALASEIPSCVCETVALFYMYSKAKNPKEIFYVLNYMLDTFFTNVNEAAAMGQFKNALSNRFLKEGVLRPEAISTGWQYFQENYSGLTKLEKQWANSNKWPYYLAPYNVLNNMFTGFSKNDAIMYLIGHVIGLVVAYNLFIHKSKKVLNYFMNFLKAGSSKKPLEDINKALKLDVLNKGLFKYVKKILILFVKELEIWKTVNKPGSLRFGKFNKVVKKGDK